MKNTPYTVSARNVTFGEALVNVMFMSGASFSGSRSQLVGFVAANGLERDMPRPNGVTTVEGVHSAYPCVMATTPEVAQALTKITGVIIAVGDGQTCASQAQARKVAASIKGYLRAPETSVTVRWGLTPARQAEAPRFGAVKRYSQEERETAVVDHCLPW